MNEAIDASGLSCPQPVIVTRRALQESSGGEVVILVDSMTQVHNCLRAGKNVGWEGGYEEQGDVFKLTFRK